MKLTIIIPVYNAADRLQVCLESVLAQTFKDYEVILINDGSKDNSLDICRLFERRDSRIRVMDKENGGAGEARNSGLRAAHGEYIGFVDADDTIDSEMMETMVALMDADCDRDVVCCAHVCLDAQKGESKVLGFDFEQDSFATNDVAQAFLMMDKNNHFCYLWNKLFKRSIIEENNIRFEKKFITGQDLDFVIKYFYHVKKCIITNYAPYNYYSNGTDSLCARYKKGLYEIVSELSEERMKMYEYFDLLSAQEGKTVYQESHIRYLHSCIPNMFRKNAKLSRQEKICIMGKLLQDEKLISYMSEYKPKGRIDRIYKHMILRQSPRYAVTFYTVLFFVRNHFNLLYRRLRGGVLITQYYRDELTPKSWTASLIHDRKQGITS